VSRAAASLLPLGARERSLAWELSKREIVGRYRGASFGVLWALLQPFLMLGVLTLAFGEVLGSRWPGAEGTAGFAIILFVGLMVHGVLAECLGKACTLITANASYVKKVVFPIELLAWPVLASAVFHFLANALVLAGMLLLVGRTPPPTLLLLPVVLLPMVLLCLGLVWALASLSVYVRDVQYVVPPLVTATMFLSSVIVPPDAVPEAWRFVFEGNPLTPVVDAARAVALAGTMPDWSALAVQGAIGLVVAIAGAALFLRLRRGFADVL
jgi:lipopolysaccharide transport system permease protein